MKESLRDVIRRLVSGSILVTGTSTPVAATVTDQPTVELPPPASAASVAGDPSVMVLRERRPRLVLMRAEESTLTLVSSHRSHRSHSSHRSHYSSSGGGSTPRARTPTPPRRATPPPAPESAYCFPTNEDFGSRLLKRGMCGSDVTELMRLLVAHDRLRESQVNTEAMFTLAVENAVKAFQRSVQLEVDGKVGSVTARHLQREP